MRFRSFEQARDWVRSLKLKSSTEWFEFIKKSDFPFDVPKRPEQTFRNKGWMGYSDWLGNGRTQYLLESSGRLSFEESRKWVQSLGLKGLKDWWAFCKAGKRPAEIPASPHTAYLDQGWKGYGDWLGTKRTRRTKFASFEDAREYSHSLLLDNPHQWMIHAKSSNLHETIPKDPDVHYKKNNEWKGWKDWLNKEYSESLSDGDVEDMKNDTIDMLDEAIKQIGSKYLDYEQARDLMHTLRLKGQKEWFEFCKSKDFPKNIHKEPWSYYPEWKNFADWLGTSRLRPTKFISFVDAREWARSLNLSSRKEWDNYMQTKNRRLDIPTHPEKYYAKTKEWINIADWLGYD
jgi:hypothetical protein